MAENPNRLEVLQLLRAIAAAFVVFVHAVETYITKIGPIADTNLNFGLGSFGVKLFFCISGYIIFSSAYNFSPGWNSASFFARRRLIRIVPLYWCATLLYAAKLTAQGQMPSAMDFLRSLLFIPYANDLGLMRPVLAAGWTLNFEMLFYAALCLSLVLDRAWRLPAVAAVFMVAVSARALGLTPVEYSAGATAWGLMADPVLCFFLVGMGVGALTRRVGRVSFLPVTWGGGVALMCAVLLLYLVPASRYGLNFVGGQDGLPVLALELAACALAVFICVQPYRPATTPAGTSLQHWLVAAGDGSYSTYLLHGFVMGPAARLIEAVQIPISPWAFSLAMVLGCSIVGIFVYRTFERPLQLSMNARWGRIGLSQK